MLRKLSNTIGQGFSHVRENQQLGYTIFVALVIIASFTFVVDRFISIAQEAQENLVNVRVGSIHDAFVAFAPDFLGKPETLHERMLQIKEDNSTITDFRVVSVEQDGRQVVLASIDKNEVGTQIFQDERQLFDLALVTRGSSITFPSLVDGERSFTTVRAIMDEGEVLAFVLTIQSLSEADVRIEREIQTGFVIFISILLLLLLLFLRYARIIDYATLYRRLTEVDQLKDDFIAMASHELRSPLASIRGYIDLMTTSKEGLSGDQKEYARRVDVSAKQLAELVDDMLDVSRIEQGRMEFEYSDFNIEDVIGDVYDGFLHIAEKKGLTLRKEGLKEIVIHSDKRKVHRVLVNLVSNAIKYTPKGEVKIGFEPEGEHVSIRVSDSGIGISKEDQENLFQKFNRIKSAETEEIKGTGLGLWLTREIIRKLKGDISVESIKGVGTHFIVRLPITRS